MKKGLVTLMISLLFATASHALSFDDTCHYDPIAAMDSGTMQNNTAQSESLLRIAQNLLSQSNQLLSNPAAANIEYVGAMLRLAGDIGAMADRIGTMADRIVATESQIGIMADRILQTQSLQNNNVARTQANILKAQANYSSLLQQLSE